MSEPHTTSPDAEGLTATADSKPQFLTEDEVRMLERIEDSGDTQGLAWRVNEIAARVAAETRESVLAQAIASIKASKFHVPAGGEADGWLSHAEDLIERLRGGEDRG